MSMEIDLKGMRILVTGASRGIGRAISVALLKAGATVGLHYNRTPQGAAEVNADWAQHSVLLKADLSKAAEANALFDEALSKLGGLDVLINNAGIAAEMPLSMEEAQWEHAWDLTMAVNLKAPAILSRRAVKHFAQGKGGRIIMISSRAAFRGDTADFMAYAASKGGLVSFTRSIARAFGSSGVKAFLLAPGFIRTDMAEDAINLYGEDFVMEGIALPRLTEPQDIAPITVLLASGLADHATGCTIDINAASYVH
jgi:NAD(P)-dependent dehydrogenase (short-subunit alcohol dehydrogenase family)